MELREVLYWEDFLFRCGAMKSRTKNWRCDSVRKSSWRIHPNSQPASKIRRICLVWVNDWGKGASNSPFSLASPRKLTAKTKPLKNHGTGRLCSFQNGPFSSHITCIFRKVPSPSFFSWGYLNQGWDSEEYLLAKDLNVWLDVFFRNWSSQMVEKLEVGELCVF